MVKRLFDRLWSDDEGALIATEFLFVATILVIGIVVGLSAVRVAVNAELTVLADAILALNPSYSVAGQSGCCASTAGSQAIYIPAQVTPPICVPPTVPQVITVTPCT
jgi:hypothetical protein